MRLEHRPEADADFDEIVAHYKAIAPEALPNIIEDLDQSFDLICDFPHMYPRQPGRSYRRHVTRKYHFKIIYEVFADHVEVIGIFRYQKRES